MDRTGSFFRVVPLADIDLLFDHLVGAGEE
jgi:hypothetical protein